MPAMRPLAMGMRSTRGAAPRSGAASPRLWLLLYLFVIGFEPCFGARPYQAIAADPLLEPWRWRTYLNLSGLDALSVTEAVNGVLWFGTANGLWRYDGIEWTRHGPDGDVGRIVTSLCGLPDGPLYAASEVGISRFDRGRWSRLLTIAADRVGDIRDIPVRKLAIGLDNQVWAATAWGILRGRDARWTLYTDRANAALLASRPRLSNAAIALFPEELLARLGGDQRPACDFNEVRVDQRGRVWFGSISGKVIAHTPESAVGMRAPPEGVWSIYDESDGLLAGAVTSILPADDGRVWVVSDNAEHARVFDSRGWSSVRLPLYLPALDIGDSGGKLFQTADGVLWLSARFKLFALRHDQWRAYTEPETPFPSSRNVVMQSSDGALWFAGPNSEIHRLDYQTPRWLTLEDLNFQWESAAGEQWFLHRDGRVVLNRAGRWTSYGPEDGLMNMPVALLGTRRGEIWVAGSHDHTAATARFDGRTWKMEVHHDFSCAIDWRAAMESSDGSLWFGAFVDTDGPRNHRNGILQFRDGVWTHHHQPGRSPRPDGAEPAATLLPGSGSPDHPIEKFSLLGESRGGAIWAGRNILARHDGTRWQRVVPLPGMERAIIESMLATPDGELWLGTREMGALRYDGSAWRRFDAEEGLEANSIRSLAQTPDGSVWAATDRGSSRFDGQTWMSGVLPAALNVAHESGGYKASPSGALWINHYTLYWVRRGWSKSPRPDPNARFRTVRFQSLGAAPQTKILTKGGVISQPGNLAVLWSGVAPWRDPNTARLQFSHRLDDGAWSPFTSDRGHAFFTLPPGRHLLQVRTRDADFNVDPTPATLEFVVLPPVWRQSWFIVLTALLGGMVVLQTVRVLREQGRLRRARDELEVRVRERTAALEAANRELQAFSYSVSHDLRAPLRRIDGFSRMLEDDCAHKLDESEKEYLRTIRAGTRRMGQLIDDMLMLARVTRGEWRLRSVDISRIVRDTLGQLAASEPERKVRMSIAPDVVVQGDANLLRIALDNLLDNAWKFTARRDETVIEFGVTGDARDPVYFVRDNGAGFDMAYANQLFKAFQRLHEADDFTGSGIGLAIVQRVIQRHGGRVWAEGKVDAGATFFFTLGKATA